MRNKYTEIIKSMEHVVNSNGPLIIEYENSIISFNCVKISMKHIEKAASQFESCYFDEIIQTTDSSFLLK